MYKPGRKKVLHHFLAFPEIYKTPEFKEKYELQARKNLAMEAESL
jgi:predicted metal-dependent HD superfamily phosphohydrolase